MKSRNDITLEVIERMKLAKIGQHDIWKEMEERIKSKREITEVHRSYFVTMTRIYKDAKVTPRSRTIHTKLSKDDPKPPCIKCGKSSTYYCNVNDEYLCFMHLLGHDNYEL